MPTELQYNQDIFETEPEFSIKKVVKSFFETILNIFKYWKLILLFVAAGSILGIAYSFIKSKTYTAKLTFVVEDAKSSGSLSSLAGQLGLDIGGLSGGGTGLIAGDNVLELLKSPNFIKKTLLTLYSDSTDNGITLADQYANTYHLKDAWKNNKYVNKDINFYATKNKISRIEDSLLQIIINKITEKELSITKPDKKLTIFEMDVTMRDEKLTQLFCERLLTITTDFYVDTKVSRLKRNVERLQKRADSITHLLNRQTYASTSENEKLIDLNPAYSTTGVTAEITARDKMVLSTIYAEVEKNLEINKTALIQETPTVQIIDHPELPLQVNKVKKSMGILEGAFAGFAISFLWLIIFKKDR